MDEEPGLPIRTVVITRDEQLRDFNLIQYAGRVGFGGSFVSGPLLPVSKSTMISSGLKLVMDSLQSYRMWPARTKIESEIGAMDPKKLNKFVRENKFVRVLQRHRGT